MIEILKDFEVNYHKCSSPKERSELIFNKNEKVKDVIRKQIKENGAFQIQSPFGEKTCKVCGGTGEIYKFFRDIKTVTCLKCKGLGNIEMPCVTCKGTGRYIQEEPPLKINVACKVCNGQGKIYRICSTCNGKGRIKKFVIAPEIKSTTLCPHCQGVGFYHETKQFNPCIDKHSQVAEQLVQLLTKED